MAESFESNLIGPELLSFGEAGRLTGKPKAYLRELAESGQLSIRLQPTNGESKFRVTRTGLAEAGLLRIDSDIALPDRGDVSELIALVREQASRISALEEQRFQLGAQLGAAIERVASLEEQVSDLVHVTDGEEPVNEAIPANTSVQSGSFVHALIESGAKNLQVARGIRSRFIATRRRFPGRPKD